MLFYKDYFKISEDYAPCMTREAINREPRTWLQFYPHETFVKLLRDLLACMNGGNKSVWLTGAYGTGKSHAALVLQKLFMDDASRVNEWLEHRKELVPEAVRAALNTLRSNRVLAVFDTKSDGLKTPEQFLVRIENSIIQALKDNNYQIPAFGSLDKIIERIREEEGNFFKKRDELQGQLSILTSDIKTADALEKAISNPELQSAMLSDVMTVMHARDIYINLSTENLLKWVDEILDVNNISKLLFIWDEFSSYIDQNRSQLKTFEEIAEASQEGKFFFLPVTHMALEAYLAAGSESAKKANGRFIFRNLDMPTNTALLLAADAFKVANAEWSIERDQLWHGISSVVTNYMATKDQECNEKPEAFKGILPIHPMTAFVLKFLSTAVGSNQRSMFNFLKGEVGESEFQDFIAQSGPEVKGRQYLTVDHLWHYFIERSDLGTGKEVNEVRIEFANKAKNLNDVEKRVFKAVLLYSLLGRLTGNAGHELIQPTLSNIERCFEGDGDVIGVENIANELMKKHCFSIINGRCEMFRSAGDSEDIEKQKAKIKEQFNEQVLSPKVQPKLESAVKRFKDKLHFEVRAASVDKAMTSCQRTKELFAEKCDKGKGNKILLQFIVAKDGEEQLLVADKAKELAKQWHGFRMLFITLPELHFCTTSLTFWEEYVDQLAHIALATDQATKTNYETQIKMMDTMWLGKLTSLSQKLVIFKPNNNGEPYQEERAWNTLEDYLKKYLKECFDCFVDDLSDYNLNAMTEGGKGLASWAKAGMDFSAAIGASQSICKAFEKRGITDSPEWFAQNPTHPLTRIRDYCKDRLNNAINGSTGQCSIRKIYIDLQRPPYAMLSIPYTAFVLGFVLKEWVNNPRQQLQWTNGAMSEKLDNATLAEIIDAVVKDDGSGSIKNEKYICRISKEEKKFIECAPVMFGIEHIPNATVEGTLDAVAKRLEKITDKVPLWVLPDFIYTQDDLYADACTAMITDLCEAQKISAKGDQQERSARIKTIGAKLQETDGLAEYFAKYIKTEYFDTAFQIRVNKIKPELAALAKEVGDYSATYCKIVKEHFANTASWLWNTQNVDDELDLVEAKYKIIRALQDIMGSKVFITYEDAISRIQKAMFADNKVSIELLAGDYPFLARFVQVMDSSKIGDGLKDFAEIFQSQQNALKDLFFDQTQNIQIITLKKHFDTLLATLGDTEIKKLYDGMSSGAKRTADDFKRSALQEINEYLKNSTVQQLLALWEQKTGYKTPVEWSLAHKMPSYVLFDSIDIAHAIVPMVNEPKSYQVGVLKTAKDKLAKAEIPDATEFGKKFLQQILPQRYAALNINASDLGDYLFNVIGKNPDKWDGVKLRDAIEKFVRDRYTSAYKSKAVDKVNSMSENEAKKLLLKFVENNPDVGLGILE